MTAWSCPHQVNDLCEKVDGAYCRPGMRGCVLFGKVTFQDGEPPYPVWPAGDGARDEPARRTAQRDAATPTKG